MLAGIAVGGLIAQHLLIDPADSFLNHYSCVIPACARPELGPMCAWVSLQVTGGPKPMLPISTDTVSPKCSLL